MFKANLTHTKQSDEQYLNSFYNVLEEGTSSDNVKVGFSPAGSLRVSFHLWIEKQEENSTFSLPEEGELPPSGCYMEESFSRPQRSP